MNAQSIPATGPSPEVRTAIFYSTMFTTAAVSAAYFAIWLNEKGVSPSDIGWINSAPVFVMLALNLILGRVADRANDWRTVIIIGSLIAAVTPIGLFFVDGFWGILIFWVLTTVPFAAIAPVADAATVRMTRRNGTDFASIRAWGTLGNMVFLALTGYVVVWFGPSAFVPLLVIVGLMRGGASLFLPRFRAPEGQAAQPVGGFIAKNLGEVFKVWFVLPVIGFALVFGTLMMMNIFVAFVWKEAGISEAIIGPLLALGAASEAVIMFVFARISRRFTARHLILISALATALRWSVMAFNPPVWVLVLLQLTHGISFGFGYLGMVNFIANWTSEDMAAEAQSISMVLQQTMAVIALSSFGYLFEIMGSSAFLIAGCICVLAASFSWLSLVIKSAKSETENGPAG